MLSNLSQGIKISITRSIKTAFEQYMARILWDEKTYRFEDFLDEWRTYIHTSASWYDKVDEEIKTSPAFHEELAAKINEVIERIFSEEPTSGQLEELEALQKEMGTDFDFSCRAEAKFYIDFLSEQLKKKKSN
ncbi:hypothetical protein F9802_06760 [Bacillus aerolatus]|uniref:Group-specific protein n=1 Tax=Bacillus aerolatus TaxID=2653354 RepID=A0A6I1FHF7_9BACI|nr:hypothetical protein [Bacillus aerolatus]KAB7707645.1 hypothetical protein F9802_06760 [Bacillus aerolatus]